MRPDRVLLCGAAAAWVLMAGQHLGELTGRQAGAAEHHGAGHPGPGFGGAGLLLWGVMCLAMMTPGMLPAARHVAYCSLRRRRGRSVALFALGPLAVWVGFAAVAMPAVTAGAAAWGRLPVLIAAAAVCVAWYPTPCRRRAMTQCHRTAPLPLRGRAARTACLRYGLRHGLACAAVCWPLMLAMAALGHGAAAVPGMAVLTLLCLAWKTPPRRARTGEFLTPVQSWRRTLARRARPRLS